MTWTDDTVTPGFEATLIPLPREDDGELVATLLRRHDVAAASRDASADGSATISPRAVLYLHGFVDYFFHPHVADAFAGHGFAFFALEMRRTGRSLRGGNRPNYVTDLASYGEEITRAIDLIRAHGFSRVTLLGHSTGALVAALYAAHGARRGAIDAVVLNNPFLRFMLPKLRELQLPLASLIGGALPWLADPRGISPRYGESLHRDFHGEWSYDLRWKPIKGFPVYYGWVRAIRHGQAAAERGLNIEAPVLLLHADHSIMPGKAWREEYHDADIVLDVRDMIRIGPKLGRDVTLASISGGKHDLFLSRERARGRAIDTMFGWLANHGAVP